MRAIRIFCLAGLLLMLVGCFDYNELNMQEIVSGVGVDSVSGKVRVNVVCEPTGGINDNEGARYFAEGNSFFEAVRELGSCEGKKLYWGHLSCILISENAARLTDEILDTVLRVQDVYLDVAPVIVRGSTAEELLDTVPADGEDVFGNISDMFANQENSRRFLGKRVWQIFREREENAVYILPTASIENNKMLLSGGAVIKNGDISVFLDGEQILALSLITREGSGGYLPTVSLPDGGSVSFEILANDIKKKEKENAVSIDVKCVLSPGGVKGKATSETMEMYAKEYLENIFFDLISFLQQNDMEEILCMEGRLPEVTCEVNISNVLGGKR